MYEIWVKDNFSAAHLLRNYRGKCENIHGHNWQVEVLVECSKLDKIGLAMDFRELKKRLSRTLKKLDHKNLNELIYFKEINPSSENIARFIFYELKKKIDTSQIRLSKVVVKESANSGAGYWED